MTTFDHNEDFGPRNLWIPPADVTDVNDYFSVESSAKINGSWVKSYKLNTVVEDFRITGKLNPCFTHYLPDAEQVEDLAREVLKS